MELPELAVRIATVGQRSYQPLVPPANVDTPRPSYPVRKSIMTVATHRRVWMNERPLSLTQTRCLNDGPWATEAEQLTINSSRSKLPIRIGVFALCLDHGNL